MAIDNRFLQRDYQPASRSDAYEAYWSSAEDDGSNRQVFPCSCQPGDAYSELWQLWDAQ
jgi:hypothetical protein